MTKKYTCDCCQKRFKSGKGYRITQLGISIQMVDLCKKCFSKYMNSSHGRSATRIYI